MMAAAFPLGQTGRTGAGGATVTERQVLFLVNPAARALPSRARLEAAIAALRRDHPFDPLVWETDGPGHATALATQAEAAGVDLIVVCGGDGTLNEALNGLSRADLPVAVIPGGTANVWAKEAGVPRDPERALRAQWAAPRLTLDLGRADGRRFLLMAGLGLDAEVVAAVRPRLKRWLGPVAYVGTGLCVGLRYPGFRVAVQFDDDPPLEVEASLMVIGNTRLYGGVAEITAEASAVDGLLDCVIFRGHGAWNSARVIPAVFLQRHLRSSRVLFRRARRIAIHNGAPALQLDGDLAPAPATEFRVEPRAVQLCVPRADRAVFRAPA